MDIDGLHARAYRFEDDSLTMRMTQYGSQGMRGPLHKEVENLPIHIGTTISEKVSWLKWIKKNPHEDTKFPTSIEYSRIL